MLNDYFKDNFKTLILEGAVRSGKTFINNKIFSMELKEVKSRAAEYGVQTPLYILAGVSSKTIMNNILIPLLNEQPYLNLKWDKNGSFTLFGVKVVLAYTGNIGGIAAIRGSEAWGAYVNEASLANEKVFKEITTRLSAPKARLICDTNPDNPSHWLKRDYIDKASDPEKRIRVHKFTIDDNEFLDPDYVATLKAQFTGVFYDRAIRGLWVMSDGAIYSNFDKDKMIVRWTEQDTKSYVRSFVSIDYGTLNATVFLLWQTSDGRHWHCTDEFYYSGRESLRQKTDDEYASELENFFLQNKIEKYQATVIIDPSAASFITVLRKRGFQTKKANNAVLDGIRTTMTAMNTGLIKFSSKCKHLINEFGLYVWDESASYRGEDKPVKQDDHCMDAMRYFVYTVLRKLVVNQEG